jgi:hypothetical protein
VAGVAGDLLEYLKDYHTEETKAIKGRELCVLFNLTDKQLRNVVSGLRQEGEAVCSSSYGYWYSTDPDDVGKTLHRLERQVANMNISIKGLEQVLTGGKG